MSQIHPFESLTPQMVLEACESCALQPTGELLQLNSYENRVFDIKLEKGDNVIAKFYRPQRWSKEALLEEHSFLNQLQTEGLKVIAPLQLPSKSSLLKFENFWVSLFPKVKGRLPQEFIGDDLKKIGRLLAQLHNIGVRQKAIHRPIWAEGVEQKLQQLERWISPEVRDRYLQAADIIVQYLSEVIDPSEFHRIHGDLHRGNILSDGQQFFLVDFDDFLNGPAVQDFWMLFSGDNDTLGDEMDMLLTGYTEFREFPDHQWDWIPALRGYRILNYAHWISQRWNDPSFPRLFPQFREFKYWAEETEALEKISWSL